MIYKRPIFQNILQRISEQRRFIQVLAGPRQTGKTTLARQVFDDWKGVSHFAAADEPTMKDRFWLHQQWEIIRRHVQCAEEHGRGLLVLDEVQKIPDWPESVKRLWDEDTAAKRDIQVLILGSSPLLVQRGLSETLTGRFELLPVTHWSFREMLDAFGWSLDQFLFFGGYPGAASLIDDELRWSRYIIDSIIETTVSRDILFMTRVDNPALLRRLFELGCSYSGRVLSYQKMLGQLQESGNTSTLAHYLSLLQSTGMLAGIRKYSGRILRQRSSSPKLQVLNTALMSVFSGLSFDQARHDPDFRGRLVESAVGASLMNGSQGTDVEVFYWNSGNREVDFILRRGQKLVAIEVKSGARRTSLPGIAAFSKEYTITRKLLVGAQGIPLEEFLLAPVSAWVE